MEMPSPLTMRLIRSTPLALLAATLIAACGGSATSSTTTAGTTAPAASTTAASPSGSAAFAWLRPGPTVPGWSTVRLSGGVVLAYPASWQRIHSDPGTASAALTDRRTDLVEEYLNATPQQGEETLQNWPTFRPDHNKEEGDSHIQVLAAARGLRFRDGHGSCVIDRYATPRTSYQEIACLVRGPHGGNVIVAAALADRWAQDAPTLERAVSAFVA